MTLNPSALLELTQVLRTADGGDLMRQMLGLMFQALVDAETTAAIGAEPHERTNGTRPKTVSTAAGDLTVKIPKLRQVYATRMSPGQQIPRDPHPSGVIDQQSATDPGQTGDLVRKRTGYPNYMIYDSVEHGNIRRDELRHSPTTPSDRLAHERHLWLCTLRRDGSPHVTPVWFAYIGKAFWISSGERNIKVRNVLNDPRVSLALADTDTPYVAEGRVRVHRDARREDVLAAIAAKYDGWDAGAEIDPFGPRVLLEVSIDRWLLKGSAQ